MRRSGRSSTAPLRDEQRPSTGRSEPGRQVDWSHRRASGVHRLDDLAAVDALQVDGRDTEVAVSQLALEDDQRHAFAGHLDGVGVAELVWREAAPHAGRGGRAPTLGACRSGGPVAPARRAVDDAEQRTDGQLRTVGGARAEVVPSPRRPSRPHGGARSCRAGPGVIRGVRRGLRRRARALPGCAAPIATGSRSVRGGGGRVHRRRRRARRQRSLRPWAGRPGSANPCCLGRGRRGIRATSPAIAVDRRGRAEART
jgi:hypothetical protein